MDCGVGVYTETVLQLVKFYTVVLKFFFNHYGVKLNYL